ncbi:MAG: methionyl-tRNA formyltransferase [Dehalococcoidia bacterium]
MRIALIGQAAFGEAVFRALRDAGEEIVAVSSVPGAPGRPDPLWAAAEQARIPAFPTGSLKKSGVLDAFAATKPDLGVMAFVTHILPERILDLPLRGTVQYHPSLLPRHRGIHAMHWALRMGDDKTGLTVFWVDGGIDTGPILLQREVDVSPDDTVGSLYFDRLFPMGVEAMVEAVRLVREGNAPRLPQDEARATYEPPTGDANSAILWSQPARDVYNLIRGSNPTPGAHARLHGERIRIFEARMTPGDAAAASGTVVAVEPDRIDIALNGGTLHAHRLQRDGAKKLPASDFAVAANVHPGDTFEDGRSDPA